MRRLASLAMYRDPPVIAEATRELWTYVGGRLRAAGLADVPEALDEGLAHDAAWRDPRLLLAQTCGYPFMTQLRGQVAWWQRRSMMIRVARARLTAAS